MSVSGGQMTEPTLCTCGVELKEVTVRILQHKDDVLRVQESCCWPEKGERPGTLDIHHELDHIPTDIRRRPPGLLKPQVTFV